MTIDEARIITKHATYYEFPTFYDLSLRLALLRVRCPPDMQHRHLEKLSCLHRPIQ